MWSLVQFALVLVFLLYLGYRGGRGSYLSKVALLEGEEILFEEDGLGVYTLAGRLGEDTHFLNCRVRVTNRRLIVGQKALFQKKWVLRYVFHIPGEGDTSLSGFYVTSYLSVDDVTVDVEKGEVRLPLGNSLLTRSQRVVFKTARAEDYLGCWGEPTPRAS